MKKLASVVCTVVLVLSLTGAAGATGFTFQPNDPGNPDLWDLAHGKYYTWGISMGVPDGEEIVGASLSFTNIRNWDHGVNDLWVNLLNSAPEGAKQKDDPQSGQVNFFDSDRYTGENISLTHWQDTTFDPQDITYEFNDFQIATLTSYIADGGDFGLGFDPDCHFYNDGITLKIETAVIPTQVPEPSTMLLLGCGLIGLVGLGRQRTKK